MMKFTFFILVMFDHSNFNGDISKWNVGNVTSCQYFSDYASSWTLPKPNFSCK